jgi:hypothetical protein
VGEALTDPLDGLAGKPPLGLWGLTHISIALYSSYEIHVKPATPAGLD